ncbi:MAG: tRNA 2-thiouridine(34) synthase MnmA [Planctomycetota bacterium]|nr:tRNA 2-thiouridine(34) synthase MnmA [Planctomycetota bacterium]
MTSMQTNRKVLVAMSGGVDSSVAAALLLREEMDVVGCFMRLGSPGETLDTPIAQPTAEGATLRIGKQGCCSINDAEDARRVAGRLDVPFYVCNFKKDFGRIIDYFVDEYNAGRTPNPCVRCNDWLKFGRLHDYAMQLGAGWVASGHHARVERRDGRARLCMGHDAGKDQSYVLFGAPMEQLDRMLLPVGEFTKDEVREKAKEMGLPVHSKPDSQEICFVPDNDYAGLVERTTPDEVREGEIVNLDGEIIGHHPGHQHFTIGQRRGIGVALGHPLYVVEKNADTNRITVGTKQSLRSIGCIAAESNWHEPTCRDFRPCTAKIRYNAAPVPARVRERSDGVLEVRFDTPQESVAPGQAVVCYEDDMVICGGWIKQAIED